jgi:hypothetical protein
VSVAAAPELSILLVADSHEMIRKVLRCYATQGDPRRLEIVVAAYPGAEISESLLRAEGFMHARVIDSGGGDLARAEARAVREATAPYVVFAQGHAYPRHGFVDAILAATAAVRWTVIGPAMANANPGSAVSRAAMRINYGPWSGARRGGPVATVPGHNSAYLRDALLALGDDLEKVLPAGARLQVELLARGATLFLESHARIEIVNVSRLRWFCADMYRQGRRFAAERRLGWSLARRLGYAAGAPLVPAVRLARILRERTTATQTDGTSPAELAALLLGLVFSAAGEMVGYLAGRSSRADFDETSFHRLRHVNDADRRAQNDESHWPSAGAVGP